jgi:hypothetical protein
MSLAAESAWPRTPLARVCHSERTPIPGPGAANAVRRLPGRSAPSAVGTSGADWGAGESAVDAGARERLELSRLRASRSFSFVHPWAPGR